MMTDAVPTGHRVEASRGAFRVVDADGHVFEDALRIVERLPEPFGRLKREELVRGGRPRLFPPLGDLASIPFIVTASADRRPEETGQDPASWEFFLDTVGIEQTVLYPTLGLTVGRIRDLDYAIALTRAYNDWIADTYLRHPSGRFQAAALLPMQAPAAAAAELTRAVRDLGFCAGIVPSNGLPAHPGSDQFFPVYETTQDLDVGLAFHGGDGHGGLGFDDFNVYAAAHALGHPFSLLRSLAGMLFNGVFERFPRLRVAFLEGGAAWILLAAERFSESFKALAPVPSERVLQLKPGRSAGEYLRQLLQEDRIVLGCEGGEAHLVAALEYFGCTPFMFSSDFPHEVSANSCRHELEELDQLPIGDLARESLKAGTAKQFYRL